MAHTFSRLIGYICFSLNLLMRKGYLFVVLCLALTVAARAQQPQEQTSIRYNNNYVPPTKAQLEAKKKEILDAINETEHQLDEIKKNKNATVSQVRALQYKLAQRQNLISNINQEIGNIDNTIVLSSKEILTLKQKLEMLKVRYAQSIRYSYETRSSYDMLAFLFSSSDFNDAVRRMKYLKKFRDFRKQQVDQIHQTQDQIQHKIGDLNKEKEEKDQLLNSQKQQSQALQGDMQEKNNAIQDLKGREAELQKKADENRKVAARVNKAINDIIEREMAAALKRAQDEEKKRLDAEAKAAAAKPAAAKPATPAKAVPGKPAPDVYVNNPSAPKAPKPEAAPLMLTPTDVALAANFEGNKGKLYWPVTQGYISDHFGTHPDPIAKFVIEENPGIDIRTSPNAPVRAVFEGTVTSVITVEGNKIVVIAHGNYFTVYNNLASTSVNKGQHINTLQTIGVVAENFEGEPTIKFQIWKSNGKKGSVKLNPEQWIGKAR